MNPNSASANRPSDRIRMKNTPMIALKRVKTLPATMDAVERLDRSSCGPSFFRRLAASLLDSPPGWVSALIAALLAERRTRLSCDRW
jgi:hypothetical protein